MRIVQLALGNIPDKIKNCMLSVKELAEYVGADYEVVSDIDLRWEGYRVGTLSDEFRLRILQEPQVMYVDWDYRINKFRDWDFTTSFILRDNLIYNYDNCEYFKSIYNSINWDDVMCQGAVANGLLRGNGLRVLPDEYATHLGYSSNGNREIFIKDGKVWL